MESLPNSLLTEINAVSRMDALTLRARYGHFFGENSTRSTASLRSEIIYKLQERHYRKSVGTETAEILNDALEKREGRKKEREPHAAGAQYVRIWHGKKHIYRVCRDEPEEPEELALTDFTVYGVDLSALFRLVSEVFGCGEPQPVASVAGAWDFGMSKFAPAKHKRRVFFVRHLVNVPKSAFATYPGCIVIAAGGLSPANADISLFSFEDVFRYAASGLSIDLDAVSLRFEERTIENKSERKPNKAMLAKMKALANHLKNIAVGFMRARRSGTEGAYAQVAKDMAKVTMPSLEKFFASDDAPCKISRSVLHEYLSGQKYADEPYASAARFWLKTCTRMDVLEAVSAVCTKKFGNKINQVDGIGASQVYMAIVKFIPPDKR